MNRVVVPSLLSAFVGGAVVAVAVAVLDLGAGATTTVVEQAPLMRTGKSAGGGRGAEGLTANEIYRRDARGVVNVKAQIVRNVSSPFDLAGADEQGEATGSGFVLDRRGTILTNAHVIEGAAKVTVAFEDDKTLDAKVVGRDSSTDLAVLRVDPRGADLHPLRLGDSSGVQVGDPTIAIGNPFGLDRTLTTGVVSALQRRISAPDGFQIDNVIQTDAAINPGNSGGPLLDAAGDVIGINSQIATGGAGQGNVGIGFAVPIDTAKQVVPELERSGRVDRAFLGVTGTAIDASLGALDLPVSRGVLVQEVSPQGPAARAGMRGGTTRVQVAGRPLLVGGDVITAVDGRAVGSMEEVAAAVAAKEPGEQLRLEVRRGPSRLSLAVTLASRPSQAVVGQG
jgi:S1-C subfamily serine protease